MVRNEREVAVSDHGLGVPAHDWGGLDVEIAQHFVAAPSSNEFDAVVIDAGA